MEVSLEDVRRIFRDVLQRQMTREDADRWAYSLMLLHDDDKLVFVPAADEEVIWEGISYLYGIDAGEAPGRYLYGDEDVRAAMSDILPP